MNTHADKTQKNKSQSISTAGSQVQSGSDSTFKFVDNRPEAIAQRKLQEMVNNYSAQQQHPIQKKENKTGLPDNLKSGIENLSGYSMDDVKVRYNSDKPAQLQAHAYAQGTDIHLGPGQEKHLPHEAWHVVQQKQGRVKPTIQMKGGVNVNNDTGLEKEADLMGSKATSAKSFITNQSFSNRQVHSTEIQLTKQDVKDFVRDKNLQIGSKKTDVEKYASDEKNPIELRIGLVTAWNLNQDVSNIIPLPSAAKSIPKVEDEVADLPHQKEKEESKVQDTPKRKEKKEEQWQVVGAKKPQESKEAKAEKKRAKLAGFRRKAEDLLIGFCEKANHEDSTLSVFLDFNGSLISQGESGWDKKGRGKEITTHLDQAFIKEKSQKNGYGGVQCAEPEAVLNLMDKSKASYSLAFDQKSRKFKSACASCAQLLNKYDIIDLYY